MHRPEHIQHSTAIAWLILGYLAAHPDAKDTAEGVTKWWLHGDGGNDEVNIVRASLQYLLRLGWLTPSRSANGSVLYGLDHACKSSLKGFLYSRLRFH